MQYAAYEWGLSSFLARLKDELRDGTYSPDSADIIRGAKSKGLSRPLAFLTPRDALVFHAIVVRARPDLVKELRSWTGAFQTDKAIDLPLHDGSATKRSYKQHARRHKARKAAVATSTDYGNFFQMWLQKQGVVYSIVEKAPYVVESDVANYFSSIDLRIVQEYLLRTGLHRDVVRLLIYLVRNVLRHPQYADSPGLGLPQGILDSSRYIAHGLLVEVDREFDELGAKGLYGRFMDDFVVGAGNMHEGEKIIARIQTRLEPLGLYPNPAKTQIFPVDEYKRRIMVDENAYLERIDGTLSEQHEGGLRRRWFADEVRLQEFLQRAQTFRDLDDRPARWEQVLRRYYRYMREVGVNSWLKYALTDIVAFPTSAPNILEYVRSFPLEVGLAESLMVECLAASELYGDIPLLLLETVATAPTEPSAALASTIMEQARSLTEQMLIRGVVPRSHEDWILAYLGPVVAKFGTEVGRHEWLELLELPRHPVQAAIRLHALPIQVALGTSSRKAFVSEMAGLSWSSVLTLDFIRALEDGDSRSRGVAIGLVNPAVRLLPNRFQLHSRAISLMRILVHHQEARVTTALTNAKSRLERNPLRLRDAHMIEIVEACLAR
ncbi:MAG TPA: RNA-directed DNA polymerase [Acidimicrobiales bacterium]|nr:RNA-directed DNA polymerase [Acidimicrobiales bacterium]